jgi:hypothetical protein
VLRCWPRGGQLGNGYHHLHLTTGAGGGFRQRANLSKIGQRSSYYSS